MKYYEPIGVFRQPAMYNNYNNEISYNNKSWLNHYYNNTTTSNKPHFHRSLRKVSEEYNDHYITQKLQSDYWTTKQLTDENVIWNDITVSNVNDKLCIANNNKNSIQLSLFQLSQDLKYAKRGVSLNKLHKVTLPKNNPVTTLSFVEFHSRRHQNDLLLTAHQNGYVHLITTSSSDGSQIVSRFNHSKFMTFEGDALIAGHVGAMPIRQLECDLNSNNGFVSLINESLFMYDISMNKSPTYLNHFPSINSFALHKDTPLVALAQSTGISFLDVRDSNQPTLYATGKNIITTEWIDQHTISIGEANSGTIQLFDIRMLQEQSTTVPFLECHLDMDVTARSLKYDSEHKTLSALDDMGTLTRWELPSGNNTIPQQCYLKNGLHSVNRGNNDDDNNDNNNIITNVLKCGDTLVKNGNISGMTLWKDTVIAHGLNELSIHRIVDVEMSSTATQLPSPTSSTVTVVGDKENKFIMNSPVEYNENGDSDATSLFDSYSEDDHADIATLRPEPLSPLKNNINDDSSLNKFASKNLSCQTIVETTQLFN
ncbi:similar to Saccharomyces cerevisiae YER124C DSE1 Daughter cell-specific protein, may regulate cross-talk between the mating and filamentation pathways [Maudiozyma saulgeensis]|uniref:Similar to Saccharomyces cerevisiae YER124C DSE1 Daughter cell-specific protein, may regulate cross-talk between the mating and filamentation pathways n=1 Tax=Maudiozyma saulgeensis TaxID=1789683 RepID=A0A1X7R044_9SACH|nr:similar to Saccharomyces cerevisiae YER124C DSE1 Daughter cell-specific protein, may regulate cross-talk between the mating and filamentation pathways [Kazachstania saulgeensis]